MIKEGKVTEQVDKMNSELVAWKDQLLQEQENKRQLKDGAERMTRELSDLAVSWKVLQILMALSEIMSLNKDDLLLQKISVSPILRVISLYSFSKTVRMSTQTIKWLFESIY